MSEGRRVAWFAGASILITFVLSMVSARMLEPHLLEVMQANVERELHDGLFWIHVGTTTAFAAIAVAILSGLGVWLVRRLRAREAELLESEKRLQAFSADAAHELRTPLTVLRAQIEGMDDRALAETLLQDVDRVTHIIEQILDKSRFDALQVRPGETANLSEICTDVAAQLAPWIIRESRLIEVIGAEEPIRVAGNAFALEQALKNLVSNAVKYSARNTTITVQLTGEPAIHVIDRGAGVPEAEREAIFERFHRADRRSGGTGLGLAIVKSVAEAHGGRVAIGDAPGGGAIFTIYFNSGKK